jgi:hypothetical protein
MRFPTSRSNALWTSLLSVLIFSLSLKTFSLFFFLFNPPPDLDSVHNDYQRHLPYLWAVPQFELQKSELYESCQQPDGMITESPGFIVGDGQCGGFNR